MKRSLYILLAVAAVPAGAQLQAWGDLGVFIQHVDGDNSRWERYTQMPRGLFGDRVRFFYTVPEESFTRFEADRVVGTRTYLARGGVYGRLPYTHLKAEIASDAFYPFTDTRFTWTRAPITLAAPAPGGFLEARYESNHRDGPTDWLSEPNYFNAGTYIESFSAQRRSLRYHGMVAGNALDAKSALYSYRNQSGLFVNNSSYEGEVSLTRDLGRAGSLRLGATQILAQVADFQGKAVATRAIRADYVVSPTNTLSLNAGYLNTFTDNRYQLNGYSRRTSGGGIRLGYYGIPKTLLRLGLEQKRYQYVDSRYSTYSEPKTQELDANVRSRWIPGLMLNARYRYRQNTDLPNPQFITYANLPPAPRFVKQFNGSAGWSFGPNSQVTLGYDQERRENPLRDTSWRSNGYSVSFWTTFAQYWFGNLDLYKQNFESSDATQVKYLTDYKMASLSISYAHWDRSRYSIGVVLAEQDGDLVDALTQRAYVSVRRAVAEGIDWVLELNHQFFVDRRTDGLDYQTWGGRIGISFEF